jgi:hypothetical protein
MNGKMVKLSDESKDLISKHVFYYWQVKGKGIQDRKMNVDSTEENFNFNLDVV